MPRFRGYQQQDAQEFFALFVDHLHTELTIGGPARGTFGGSSSDEDPDPIPGRGGGDGAAAAGGGGGAGAGAGRSVAADDGDDQAVLFPPSSFLADKFQGVQCTEIKCVWRTEGMGWGGAVVVV
jgi:hypothetical protein